MNSRASYWRNQLHVTNLELAREYHLVRHWTAGQPAQERMRAELEGFWNVCRSRLRDHPLPLKLGLFTGLVEVERFWVCLTLEEQFGLPDDVAWAISHEWPALDLLLAPEPTWHALADTWPKLAEGWQLSGKAPSLCPVTLADAARRIDPATGVPHCLALTRHRFKDHVGDGFLLALLDRWRSVAAERHAKPGPPDGAPLDAAGPAKGIGDEGAVDLTGIAAESQISIPTERIRSARNDPEDHALTHRHGASAATPTHARSPRPPPRTPTLAPHQSRAIAAT